MIESVLKVKDLVFSDAKLSKEQLQDLKAAYEDVVKIHNVNSKLDTSCSSCVNHARMIVGNYVNEQEDKEVTQEPIIILSTSDSVADIFGAKRPDNPDNITRNDRSRELTKDDYQLMNEQTIKDIAKDKGIKIGRSSKEVLIDKILEDGNK